MASYTCALPFVDDSYTRTFEAEIDNLFNSEVQIRGTLADHRCTFAYDWIVRIPDYEILQASVQHVAGEPDVLSPVLLSCAPSIKGKKASQGFTRTMREILGDVPGHQEHLALAMEMARVSLQAFPVPKDDHERFAFTVKDMPPGPSRRARMLWERDRADFSQLNNSCFAYRDQSAQIFDERIVETFDPDMTSPEPGQKRFFQRTKRLHITRHSDAYYCHNEMDDPFQQMKIDFALDADGTVYGATSQPGQLPFRGICEEPHKRTARLNGLMLNKKFARLIADHIGGANGCSHLFDLATDCLRLFEWPD